MVDLIMSCIIFILGGVVGVIVTLFICGVGKSNKEHDYYQEGFMDGYNKGLTKQ